MFYIILPQIKIKEEGYIRYNEPIIKKELLLLNKFTR